MKLTTLFGNEAVKFLLFNVPHSFSQFKGTEINSIKQNAIPLNTTEILIKLTCNYIGISFPLLLKQSYCVHSRTCMHVVRKRREIKIRDEY